MKMPLSILAALALSACATVAPRPADPAAPASWAPVDPQRLSDWTRALASDELQAAQDVALAYRIGMELANSRSWPQWRPESEFRAVRQQSAARRR